MEFGSRNWVIDEINYFEQKYPVSRWKIGDIDIWPIVRIHLGFYLYNIKAVQPKKEQHLRSKLAFIAQKIIALYRLFTCFFIKKKIIVSGFSAHRSYLNKEFYNRFTDPILDQITDVKYLYLEVDKNEKSKYHRASNILFTKDILWIHRFVKYKSKIDCYELEMYEHFFSELKDRYKGELFSQRFELQNVIRDVRFIEQMSHLYQFILKIIKPKAVFVLCYYDFHHYSLIHACRKIGVPVTDIQHGGQDSTHVAYGKWENMGNNGFNLLPNYFWVWDENTANVTRSWNKNIRKIDTVVGGHPWVLYWKDKVTYKQNDKKNILFSLQPYETVVLPDFLVEAIKESSKKYNWWMRLHPRQLHKKTKIVELFEDIGIIDKVEFEWCTVSSLPEVLAQTYCHVTEFSGVVIEAEMMNVPSILINKKGEEIYTQQINKGTAKMLSIFNSSELLNYIDTIENITFCTSKEELNLKFACNAFSKFLS